MKKWIICVLVLSLLLVGCTKSQETTIGINTESTSTDITNQVQPTDPTGSNKLPPQKNDFTWYVNISNENVWDLCPFMDTELTYLFLTNEPLTDDKTPMLMFTYSCQYTDEEVEEEWMTEFPFWLYQTYRGVDWNEVSRLEEAAQAGDAEAAKTLAEYETLYLSDYEALTPADIPQVYGYWITNNVTSKQYKAGSMAERYEAVEFRIGEEKLKLDAGRLDLYSKGWDQYLAVEGVEDLYIERLEPACPTYWGDGKVTLAPMKIAWEGHAQTLTGMELHGVKGEILDIQISYGDITQSWDGVSPFEIPAKTPANITVTLQTQANQTVGYCEDANISLTREKNGVIQRLWYFASISQSWNIYELYALMVDGLNIGAYYTYTTQWQQPESIEQPETTQISFDAVTIEDTARYSMHITGASWDNYAYTLHISATNNSDKTQEIWLGDVYINNWYYDRPYSLQLEPGESGEYAWHIPWEAMAAFGINVQSGEDVYSIAIGTDFPNYVYKEIYPFGQDAVQNIPPQGTIVLETGLFRLYAVQHGVYEYSGLREDTHRLQYEIVLVMESFGSERFSFVGRDFFIDGISTNGVAADAFRGGVCSCSRVRMNIEKKDLAEFQEAETLTFTLEVNNSETYTVTIDLTQLPKGE